MNVTLLNPEVLSNLYKNHGEFARECYDTPKQYAERVGKSCEESGHMSGSRCEYIKFEIEGDRGTLEQMMRSEIGVRYNPEEKYFYLYLLSNSRTTQCGCYELPCKVIEMQTGYNRETVQKLLKIYNLYHYINLQSLTITYIYK